MMLAGRILALACAMPWFVGAMDINETATPVTTTVTTCFEPSTTEQEEDVANRILSLEETLLQQRSELQQHQRKHADDTRLQALHQKHEEIHALSTSIQQLYSDIDVLVHQLNRVALQDLQQRLQDVHQQEMTLQLVRDQVAASSQRMRDIRDETTLFEEQTHKEMEVAEAAVAQALAQMEAGSDPAVIEEMMEAALAAQTAGEYAEVASDEDEDDASVQQSLNYMTKDELGSQFDVDEVLKDSENEFYNWAMEFIKDQIDSFWRESLQLFQAEEARAASEKRTQVSSSKDGAASAKPATCVASSDAVHSVQSQLNKWARQDSTGLLDLAQNSRIVYAMTSRTYTGAGTDDDDVLGNVWWRKYIPQDWEEHVLPQGWEQWSIGGGGFAKSLIPSYVLHALSLPSAANVPPEAVLNPHIGLGSCWPMHGTQGQITFELVAPINIQSVSIDHLPSRIASQLASTHHFNDDAARSSAPRQFRIVGYHANGFDADDGVVLGTFEYDVQGPTTQIFDLLVAPPAAVASEDDDDVGSCSATGPSCGSGIFSNLKGITIQILNNWGNPEYTSLYRLRVHGELS